MLTTSNESYARILDAFVITGSIEANMSVQKITKTLASQAVSLVDYDKDKTVISP